MRLRLAVLCAVALLAAACAGDGETGPSTTIEPIDGRPPLASVNGAPIPIIDVTRLHMDFGELTSDQIASSVSLLVLNRLLFDEAAEQFGVAPEETEIAAAMAARTERFATDDRRDDVLSSRNETVARVQLESQLDALSDAVARHLVTTSAAGYDADVAYQAYLLTAATVCVRHIQVLTDEGYQLVESRLAAGDDFATVAVENSLDPFVDRTDGGSGTGGDLGCRTPESTPFPAAALDAEVGVFTGPVFSSVGTHLIEVYERTAPTPQEVEDEILELGVAMQGPDLFTEWAIGVLQAADVTIDSAFGVWGVPDGSRIPTVLPAGS